MEATTNEILVTNLGNVEFGLAILIVIQFTTLIGMYFNVTKVNKNKRE